MWAYDVKNYFSTYGLKKFDLTIPHAVFVQLVKNKVDANEIMKLMQMKL